MNRARRVVTGSVHDRYVRTRMRIPRATPQPPARRHVGLHRPQPLPGNPAQVEELARPTPGACLTQPGGAGDRSSPTHLTTESVGEVVGQEEGPFHLPWQVRISGQVGKQLVAGVDVVGLNTRTKPSLLPACPGVE